MQMVNQGINFVLQNTNVTLMNVLVQKHLTSVNSIVCLCMSVSNDLFIYYYEL